LKKRGCKQGTHPSTFAQKSTNLGGTRRTVSVKCSEKEKGVQVKKSTSYEIKKDRWVQKTAGGDLPRTQAATGLPLCDRGDSPKKDDRKQSLLIIGGGHKEAETGGAVGKNRHSSTGK